MGLLPKNFGRQMKDLFKGFKKEASKTIYVYGEPSKEDCPNCYMATVTGSSTNTYNSSFVTPTVIFGITVTPTPFMRGRCPICRGKGELEQEDKKAINALVRWNPTDASSGALEHTAAGVEGFNIVQIKASKCYYDILRDCQYVTVDGVKCVLLRPPVLRSIAGTDILTIAYFSSSDVGKSVRE